MNIQASSMGITAQRPTLCATVTLASSASAQPIAAAPCTLAAFKAVAPGSATAPDYLAVSVTAGSSGSAMATASTLPAQAARAILSSMTSVQGRFCRTFRFPVTSTGSRIDPKTNDIWATENEDGNPTVPVKGSKALPSLLQPGS
jgi:hypothetical protein